MQRFTLLGQLLLFTLSLTEALIGIAAGQPELQAFALTAQGHALKERARNVPQSILAASDCSIAELIAMKDEIVALRDRLNAVIGE